jgi:peptide chain release factor subunit 1
MNWLFSGNRMEGWWMIDRQELRELASYRDEENLICSFYYPLEKGEPTEQGALIRLRNMTSEIMANHGDWTRAKAKSVSEDLERIEGLVAEELVLRRGGVAVFSCSDAGLWRVFQLSDKVGPLLAVEHTIRLRPLIEFLARYERYCTALVGKGRARIFLLDSAGVEERADVFGEVPGRHDQGGWAQARYQRHHDDRVMRHLKDTAEETFSALRKEEFDRLFVGGTEELVSEFVEYLHPYVKERFAGSFPAEMTSSPAEVQQLTLAEADGLREARQRDVIEKLRAEVHSGNLGAAGLEDTFHALQKGQVMMLLINEDFERAGFRCVNCGQLSVTSPCPLCGGETEVVPNIVEEMVKQAFLQNCELMFVNGDDREKLAELGDMGALLRFAG